MIDNGCISEGANMPSTPDAVLIYLENKILYGPGKAANTGGVAVSGLEMSQNVMHLSWTRDKVDNHLKRIMKDIHNACVKYGKSSNGFVNYVNGLILVDL